MSVSTDNTELLRAQLDALSRLVPLLYFILTANAWGLAHTFIGRAPDWLSLYVVIGLSAICAIRLVQWWRKKGVKLTDEQAANELRRTNRISAVLGISFSSWALALFPYGDTYAQAYVGTFLIVAMLSCMLCLIHLRSAAVIVALTVSIPFATFFALSGIETLIRTAINVALITVAVVIVILIQYRDFTRMIAAQKRTELLSNENLRLANLDSLTGLPNRRAFFVHLDEVFRTAKAKRTRITLGVIDLDGFKPVNDLYGHAVGDKLLAAVGDRLSSHCSSATFFMARLGGDEFAYVVIDAPDDEAIVTQGKEIAELLRAPFALPEATVQISGSVGISVYPEMTSSPDHLFEQADYALYHGKSTRRGSATLFSADHEAQISSDARIEQALKRADLEQELSVVFQPIVDIRTQAVTGFEALARWTSPTIGRVSPGQFIPVAERAGIIGSLTRPLLKKALTAAAQWPLDTRLSFNLSSYDLNSAESALAIMALIENGPFDPHRLDLEITETAFTHDFEQVQRSIGMLRLLGCGFSLDDFGTGYSSLSRLHALPLTKIKIDRSFVTGLHNSPASYKIVKSLLALSRDMGLDCVIEGVETYDELTALSQLGGVLVQGYFYSPPIAADVTAAFLSGPVVGGLSDQQHPCTAIDQNSFYAGLSDGVMDFIRQFDPNTLTPLLEGLAASDMATAIFDPEDRLVFASPAFRDLYCVPEGEQTFSSIIRNCHLTRQGPQIDTTDIDAWLTMANSRRRTAKHRKFEVDLVDGRWLWALETTYGEGWVLIAFMDLTTFKRKEIDLRIARDAAVLVAETDHLTGLASRRSTMNYLDDCINAAADAPLAVALMDIDHFKHINDAFGHDVGDKVLQRFGHQAKGIFRNSDRVGRLGGEEFLLIMPNTDRKSALRALQRFSRQWERVSGQDDANMHCTFSAGLAQWQSGQSATDLYRIADQALYAAKNSGRNRVVTADNTSNSSRGNTTTAA